MFRISEYDTHRRVANNRTTYGISTSLLQWTKENKLYQNLYISWKQPFYLLCERSKYDSTFSLTINKKCLFLKCVEVHFIPTPQVVLQNNHHAYDIFPLILIFGWSGTQHSKLRYTERAQNFRRNLEIISVCF